MQHLHLRVLSGRRSPNSCLKKIINSFADFMASNHIPRNARNGWGFGNVSNKGVSETFFVPLLSMTISYRVSGDGFKG